MTDIKEIIEKTSRQLQIDNPEYSRAVTKFLVTNKWFGCAPTKDGNKLMIDDKHLEFISEKIAVFSANYERPHKDKAEILIDALGMTLPKTAKLFSSYVKQEEYDEKTIYTLTDFLLTYLPGELQGSTDTEVATLMEDGYDNLTMTHGVILAGFINWVKDKLKEKVIYQNAYFMNQHSDKEGENTAYDQDTYMHMLYCLYADDNIKKNNMYVKAAESRNYADTWLFLSLNFLCTLRTTDTTRIPHPRLTDTPENILSQIKDGTFPESSARFTTHSVLWHLEALALTPHKREGASGVSTIKLHIPQSAEVHIGRLFAIAEAHFRIAGEDKDKPLIRVIKTYEQINRYMGEEIGELFVESDFKVRAMNKSNMQMIYSLTGDVLGKDDEFNVKGYILVALARSHKGSYGEFAKTTVTYLKDAKMSGYTPEFVARELFERGVLSLIPHMLLKMIGGEEYKNLSVEAQTEAIKNLNMSPNEVEKAVAIVQKNVTRSTEIVKSIYENRSKEDILKILHHIGNGEAVSKSDRCMCVMTAMGKLCPFTGQSNCIGCAYEISTKTTIFLMIREIARLKESYKTAQSPLEKARCKAIVTNVIAPCVEEILNVTESIYGKEEVEVIEKMIRELQDGE